MPTSISSNKRTPCSALCAGLFLGLFLVAAPANAGDEDRDFQDHYQRGVQLYKLNVLRQAVKEFIAAYAINPLPRLLYNVGQLQRKLGDYKEAADSYELYLRTETDLTPERRAEVQRYIDALRAPMNNNPAQPPGSEAQTPSSTSQSGDAPTLLMILPPSATGKAGKYMFNMSRCSQKCEQLSAVTTVGVNSPAAKLNLFDERLHPATGYKMGYGAVQGVEPWAK